MFSLSHSWQITEILLALPTFVSFTALERERGPRIEKVCIDTLGLQIS